MQTIQTPKVAIDGKSVDHIRGIDIDLNLVQIRFDNRASIYLYAFNAHMFASESKRVGSEQYVFEGPRLGFYSDTADPREGPFVNHAINRLEINLQYLSSTAVLVGIKGSADLAQSSMDSYWYRGETSGSWEFDASFTHAFS